jgi:hypothetical protein
MAQTIQTKAPATVLCTVVRALFLDGQRQEVGTVIEITTAQYAESATAGKVGPVVDKPEVPELPEAAKAPKAPKAPKADQPDQPDQPELAPQD